MLLSAANTRRTDLLAITNARREEMLMRLPRPSPETAGAQRETPRRTNLPK